MWIVQLALRRPYTFVVMALLIAILGGVTIARMAVDIFPEIDIPVVAVVWTYTGMSPEDMETRVIGPFERNVVSTVTDIEHIESQSLYGIGVTKIFLQPGTKLADVTPEINADIQTALKQMPPGIFPALLIPYSATNVPIVQVSIGSPVLSEQQLFDLATNVLKPGLATVPGAQMPYPFGGKVRQIMVDIEPDKLYAWGLSPADVTNAINAQNLIVPSGTAKIGANEYQIILNSSPTAVAELNDLPIRTVRNTTVYVRDVARVHDGFAPQTSIVDIDGKRGVLQPILKSGASTLSIVQGVKDRLPGVLATLPRELEATLLADQSLFVRSAIGGVVKEAAIASGLTALMILVFLGSWRSTFIVVVSIPLSILVSIIALSLLGQTLNTMTLGGLALAVGILVDDATVELENTHRNFAQGKPIVEAILAGASQIAVPAFVSTLCICIVFVPVAFIAGAAKFLFLPLALAVVFAMLASYMLSRTLVPTMMRYLLASEHDPAVKRTHGRFARFHQAFEARFERLRAAYGRALAFVLGHPRSVIGACALVVAASAAIFPLLGEDFFPEVDSGQIRLHVRAPAGTRIEETERLVAKVESTIRELIPRDEVRKVIANIGIPNSGINLALSDGSLISPADAELLVTLDPRRHGPTAEHVERLRAALRERFHDATFFFQPPDIETQVLNFGLAAPIDIQIAGPRGNQRENAAISRRIRDELARVPGAVDVHLQQVTDTPEIAVSVDRSLASNVGLTQSAIANSVLVSLSSSSQLAPNFWLDPATGVMYPVAVMTPQYKVDSVGALSNTPIASGGPPQLLSNLAPVRRTVGATNVTHWNLGPTFDVLANVQGRDLGRVSAEIDRVLARERPTLPRGTTVTVRGQVSSMRDSFSGLASGIVFAVVLVYLLMVVNFQSWSDPAIILAALPGALSGIVWMLFATGTPLSVPALMGAIMSVGVATANSILMVTFAKERLAEGKPALEAALEAGTTRLRPVIMTALAMIVGMLPMSLGLGDGGESNAPLGRAVIGGLAFATVATLFLVPVVFSAVRSRTQEVRAS